MTKLQAQFLDFLREYPQARTEIVPQGGGLPSVVIIDPTATPHTRLMESLKDADRTSIEERNGKYH